LFITTQGESYLQHYSEGHRRYLLGTNQEDYLQLLIDTHGEEWFRQYNPLSEEQRELFRAGHLIVLGEEVAGSNQCHSFHTEQYMRETLAKNLVVADFIPGGAENINYQDVYLLRKP